MNVALVGSVSSSWTALDALIRGGVEVTGVLGVDESQAARISDYRSLRDRATEVGLPFMSFVRISEPQVETFLQRHPPDLLWVIGLSQLVPRGLIAIARIGGVGFHPTMLPEGRGRAPVAWTILEDARAAANLFFLTDQPDAGDIIAQREVPVRPDDYSEDLIARTNDVLAEVILELAPRIRAGDIPRTPQDHSRATYYPKRTPADGLIDWSESTDRIYRLIRASGRPYPGAFTHHEGRKLTVWRGQPADQPAPAATSPGTVLAIESACGVLVATQDGAIWLTDLACAEDPAAVEHLEVGARLA
jgi:methionyl-tRNA formyltransferase